MRECEELLKIVQRNKNLWLDLAGGSRLASRQNVAHLPSMLEAKESHQLLHYKTKVSGWLGHLLATQPSREVKSPEYPVWEKLTFHIPSHPTIYRPLYPRF